MKDAKRELVTIPFPLTDSDKADAADRIVEIKNKMKVLDESKKNFITQYNEDRKDLDSELDTECEKIEKNIRTEEHTCRVRKNFKEQPPVLEYVDLEDDSKVMHSVPLEAEHHQLLPGDWLVEENGDMTTVPQMETAPDEEEDSEGDDKED